MNNNQIINDILFCTKHPKYRGTIQNISPLIDNNPSCGDYLKLFIEIKNQQIVNFRYDGHLCAISTYGAEILGNYLIHKNVDTISNISSDKLLKNNDASVILQNPVRLKCLEACQRAIRQLTSDS